STPPASVEAPSAACGAHDACDAAGSGRTGFAPQITPPEDSSRILQRTLPLPLAQRPALYPNKTKPRTTRRVLRAPRPQRTGAHNARRRNGHNARGLGRRAAPAPHPRSPRAALRARVSSGRRRHPVATPSPPPEPRASGHGRVRAEDRQGARALAEPHRGGQRGELAVAGEAHAPVR